MKKATKGSLSRDLVQFHRNLGDFLVCSGQGELFNHVDAGLPMWTGDGDRTLDVHIRFVKRFADPPVVSLGTSGIDSAHDQNLRFRLTAEQVTSEGFVARFFTWGDTHIARAEVSWIAVGVIKPSPVTAFDEQSVA